MEARQPLKVDCFFVFPLPASLRVDHFIVVVFVFQGWLSKVLLLFLCFLTFFCQKRRWRLHASSCIETKCSIVTGIQNEGVSTVEGWLFFLCLSFTASLCGDHLIVVVFCFSRLIVEGFVVVFMFPYSFFRQKRRWRLRALKRNVASWQASKTKARRLSKVDCFFCVFPLQHPCMATIWLLLFFVFQGWLSKVLLLFLFFLNLFFIKNEGGNFASKLEAHRPSKVDCFFLCYHHHDSKKDSTTMSNAMNQCTTIAAKGPMGQRCCPSRLIVEG